MGVMYSESRFPFHVFTGKGLGDGSKNVSANMTHSVAHGATPLPAKARLPDGQARRGVMLMHHLNNSRCAINEHSLLLTSNVHMES
jgi:hypothetical protein